MKRNFLRVFLDKSHGYLCFESYVDFSKLTDRMAFTSPDGRLQIRCGRLLHALKPRSSESDFVDAADMEVLTITTSDARVASLLGINCCSREHIVQLMCKPTACSTWLLESNADSGSFACHERTDGYDIALRNYLGGDTVDDLCSEADSEVLTYHDADIDIARGKPCSFVSVACGDPNLYINHFHTGQEIAEGLRFLLTEAYVYQVIDRRSAGQWKIGTFETVQNLLRKEYRESFFPHLLQACRSFMTDSLICA